MEMLKARALKQIDERHQKNLTKIQTEEGLKEAMRWYNKKYKDPCQVKMERFFKRKYDEEKAEITDQLNRVAQAEDFKGDFIITVEWKDSRMWRSNPRAYTNTGFTGESIGGCGYCKLSTATAQALNSNDSILKLLYQKKEQYLKDNPNDQRGDNEIHREVLGYGSGYSAIPSFEGGVGVSSHQRIIENLGLKWQTVTNTPNTDVFLISRP